MAVELLDKKASLFSERPVLIFAGIMFVSVFFILRVADIAWFPKGRVGSCPGLAAALRASVQIYPQELASDYWIK